MLLAALSGDLAAGTPALVAWLRSAWEVFGQDAGTTLIASIWQSAVIVCGLEIALRMMTRISAAQRFAIWTAGFGVAAGLPLLPLIHFGAKGAGATAAGAEPARALLQIDARWGLAIAGIWVAASAIRGVDLAVHSLRLRRLWKAAVPVAVSESVAAGLKGVRKGRVTICTTEMLDRPSVIGFLVPRILIPKWLIDRLSSGELEQIVLHEAEHLLRRDDWTNLAQKLALVAFPLNPALAWMESRLCREREMACDEGVVRITNAPRAYAACLANLAERGLERRAEALSLGAWHKRSELVHRVHGILLRKRGMSRAAAGVVLGAVGCALVGATVEMARCPQLVAFVPKQKTLAMTPAREQQMTAMLARESAEAKMTLPAGYEAVPAKAVAPVAHQTNQVNLATHGAVKSPPARSRATEHSQVAMADAAGDRINTGSPQWVVLADWEEVHTVSRINGWGIGSDRVSDYDTAATAADATTAQAGDVKAAAQDKGNSADPAAGRYTFTQLILRIVPATQNSNSSQPAIYTVRQGWLVIQL